MSDASQREWRFSIDDMIDFDRKVLCPDRAVPLNNVQISAKANPRWHAETR